MTVAVPPEPPTTEPKVRELAERVGFEPTCRFWRQDAFEAPPLRPLRYLSPVEHLRS
jgi:hypothetical protein